MPEWVRIEQVFPDVIAIRPVYTATGKATEVITRNGKVGLDPRDVRSVQRALFRCCLIDPRAQKAVVKKLVGKELTLPFYLSPDRVFIPLKMRQPQAEHDPVYGYVDLNFIARIEQTPDRRCRLTLTNGITMDLFCTRDTAIKSRECGARLLESLQDKNASTDLEGLVLGAVTGLIQMMIQMHQDLTRINRRLQALLPDDVEE